MKLPCGNSPDAVERRDFIKTAMGAALYSPLLGGSKPFLEPLFRKERLPKPLVETPQQCWDEGFAAVFDELKSNLMSRIPFVRGNWAQPAPRFLGTYLWDTCFISQVWALWKPDIAWGILTPFLQRQRSNGRVPHRVDPFHSSGISQPPLLAWAIRRLSDIKPNPAFLKKAYPALVRYHEWFSRERYRNRFYFWEEPYESGMDNSPRFYGRADESLPRNMKKLVPVDLNSEMVIQLQNLAKLAIMLGRNSDAKKFLHKATVIKARINSRMWNEREGIYCDLYDGKCIDTQTIASLFPAMAGIPTDKQIPALVDTITDPGRFWTPMPFPSVAKSDPNFELDAWRGPVWINTSYMVIKGLERIGRRDIAAEAARRVVKNVYRTWSKQKQFYEFYNPMTGGTENLKRKKGNMFKNLLLGGAPVKGFVGWTGLVNTILVEDILGVRWKNSKLAIEPAMPPEWVGRTVRYKSPYLKLDVNLTLERPDKVRVNASSPSAGEMVVPNVQPWKK